jgi:hypothetical protein
MFVLMCVHSVIITIILIIIILIIIIIIIIPLSLSLLLLLILTAFILPIVLTPCRHPPVVTCIPEAESRPAAAITLVCLF